MFECLFCRHHFEDMPFYGCCLSCYLKDEKVRAEVDEAHLQPEVSGVMFRHNTQGGR